MLFFFQEYTPLFEKYGLLTKSKVNKLFKTVGDILSIHKIGQIEMCEKFDNWYTHEKIGALFSYVSISRPTGLDGSAVAQW